MLAYIEFNDGTCGYYECEDIYIDSRNINTSEVYFGKGSSMPFCSMKRVTLCKDGGEFSKTVLERRDQNENDFNGEHQKI